MHSKCCFNMVSVVIPFRIVCRFNNMQLECNFSMLMYSTPAISSSFARKLYNKYSFPIRCTETTKLNFGWHMYLWCITLFALCLPIRGFYGSLLSVAGMWLCFSLSLFPFLSIVSLSLCVWLPARVDSLGFDYKLAHRWTHTHSATRFESLSFDSFPASITDWSVVSLIFFFNYWSKFTHYFLPLSTCTKLSMCTDNVLWQSTNEKKQTDDNKKFTVVYVHLLLVQWLLNVDLLETSNKRLF